MANDDLIKDQNKTLDKQTTILEGQDKLLNKISSGITDINKKTPKIDLDRDVKSKEKGGTVDSKTKKVIEDIGGIDLGSISTLAIALGAVGGLSAPGIFSPAQFAKSVDFFKTKSAPKLNKIFNTDFPELHKSTIKYGDSVKQVGRNAKGQFVRLAKDTPKITDDIRDAVKSSKALMDKIPRSFSDITKSLKDVGKTVDVLSSPKDIAAIGGKFGTAAKFVVKNTFGRALSVAGNPIFSYISMGKDVFDVANAVTDDDVRTSVKKEDIGALVGGFIGGAIGIIGGPAGVALGIGLGNMAGEFIGSAMDSPEIIGAIDKVKNGLDSEKTSLATEIADIQKQLDDEENKPSKAMAALLNEQLKISTDRQTSVTNELKVYEKGGDLDKAKQATIEAGIKGDALAAQKAKLEADIEAADEIGDSAKVAYLTNILTQTELDFKDAEKDYEAKAKNLREVAQKTSGALAESSTNFFDKIATEGGVFGSIFSVFGAGLKGESGGKYLEQQFKKIDGKIAEQEALIKSGDDFDWSLEPRIAIISKLKRERTRLEGVKTEKGLARGGFIVNKPTYLPNSGIVVGEHGTYSGRGAAYGGIADGGPEAVIPLGSTRAGAFIDPIAQSIAGQILNQLQMERMSGGGSGMGGASIVTGNDMSSSQVNNNTTVVNNPSPIGQTLPDEGRDFVSKVA
jgi:hypothetical protein